MEKDFDRLIAALRAVARDDATLTPHRINPQLIAALRSSRRRISTAGRRAGLGIAAVLVAAISGALWFTVRPPRLGTTDPERRTEITTSFIPLAYAALPYTDAQIVRMEVPQRALASFGLASPDVAADGAAQPTVTAEVLIGEDGLARAIRFVRQSTDSRRGAVTVSQP